MTRRSRVGLLLVLGIAATMSMAAQLSIRFSVDSMSFGRVGPCSGARDSFLLINDGTRVVPSPGLSVIPGFRVEAENEDNILPGEQRKMYVTFIGNAVVGAYTEQFELSFRIQGEFDADTLHLSAERSAGRCCVFRVDTISGSPGDERAIVLRQDSTESGVFLSDITSTFTLDYDASVLVPVDVPSEVITRSTGLMRVRVRLRDSDGELVRIPVRMALGRTDSSSVRIVDRQHSDLRLVDTVYAGPVTLTSVCRDPRARLFDPDAPRPTVRVHDGVIVVDGVPDGVPVRVMDLRGREIAQRDHTQIAVAGGVYVVLIGRYAIGPVVVP